MAIPNPLSLSVRWLIFDIDFLDDLVVKTRAYLKKDIRLVGTLSILVYYY